VCEHSDAGQPCSLTTKDRVGKQNLQGRASGVDLLCPPFAKNGKRWATRSFVVGEQEIWKPLRI
jgi:hypothetical protein